MLKCCFTQKKKKAIELNFRRLPSSGDLFKHFTELKFDLKVEQMLLKRSHIESGWLRRLSISFSVRFEIKKAFETVCIRMCV